jgi:predicted aconitase with swiveling domain
MSETLQIRGRGIAHGRAEGKALVARATLSFWGEFDAATGTVIAVGHPLEGVCLAGRVLVIRSTKGSSATPMMLKIAHLEGKAPAALVNPEVDALAALACIVNGIPLITDLRENPFSLISNGDQVIVDADRGLLTVIKS